MSVALSNPSATRTWSAWLELTKPNILLLVMVTGQPARLLAADGLPSARDFWGAASGIGRSAAAAAS